MFLGSRAGIKLPIAVKLYEKPGCSHLSTEKAYYGLAAKLNELRWAMVYFIYVGVLPTFAMVYFALQYSL